MTVATTASSVTYQGNGVNKNWSFAFLIPTGTLVLTITHRDDGTIVNPAASTYSVTGLDNPNGGTVIYPLVGAAVASTHSVTVQRLMPYTQTTDITNQGDFNAETLENGLDRTVLQIQQVHDQVERALILPVGATDVSAEDLMAAILAGEANALRAEAAADRAEAVAVELEAALPIDTPNLADGAVTTAKIDDEAVGLNKLALQVFTNIAGMLNGNVVGSINANSITFSIRTRQGDVPTAADSVFITFSSDTQGYTVRELGADLSFTISAGSTIGFANGVPAKLWIVIFDDGGTLRLAAINCLNGTSIYPLGRNVVASAVAEGGTGAADSSHVFYAAATVTDRSYTVIATATFNNGLTTAGSWNASPTIHSFRGGTPLPGQTIQSARSTFTTVLTGIGTYPVGIGDTLPAIGQGTQYMTVAITPTNKTNLLAIEVVIHLSTSIVGDVIVALHRDSGTAVASCVPFISTADHLVLSNIRYEELAGSVTAITYSVRAGTGSGTLITVNGSGGTRLLGGSLISEISAKEIVC